MKIDLKNLYGYLPKIIEKYGYTKCRACEIYPFQDSLGNSYDIVGKCFLRIIMLKYLIYG